MRCGSALSTTRDTDAAFQEVLNRLAEQMGDEPADLALAFASPHHTQSLARLANLCRERGLGRHVLGCSGESIVGEGSEIEGEPAVSLWSIRLPGAELTPLRLGSGEDGMGVIAEKLATAPKHPEGRLLLLLGDPFTFSTDSWFETLHEVAPGLRVVGGMASASATPGQNRLVLDGEELAHGAVALLIDSPTPIRTIVSQGCRPIGQSMIVTRVDQNFIRELGRRPALQVLQETFEALSPADQNLVREGLHIGRVINEYQESFHRGDFLVRNVMGADEAGGIAITDLVRVGQTVQFHVRDAGTADEDLHDLLTDQKNLDSAEVAGALLFTCNGRGSRLFPAPNHDVSALRETFGPIPVAGFFAMGELGPIGGQNFVHGFTASIALFYDENS